MEKQVRHVGIIMDGNRRWAKQRMLKTKDGHERGAYNFIEATKWCLKENIPYLTLYAFSTENWNRSEEEIEGICSIFLKFVAEELEALIKNDIRIVHVGDTSRIAPKYMEAIRKAEKLTEKGKRLFVQVAFSYGGRDEIVRAVRSYAKEVADGREDPAALSEEKFESYMDTAGVPDMDLVIRTGGAHRLSNFFPWQTTYAELWFTDVLWPDFTYEGFKDALAFYDATQINHGK